MTQDTLMSEIERLRSTLLLMDSIFRTQRNKSVSPVEIASTLKALRMLSLSVEAGGLDACFAMDAPTENEVM